MRLIENVSRFVAEGWLEVGSHFSHDTLVALLLLQLVVTPDVFERLRVGRSETFFADFVSIFQS